MRLIMKAIKEYMLNHKSYVMLYNRVFLLLRSKQ